MVKRSMLVMALASAGLGCQPATAPKPAAPKAATAEAAPAAVAANLVTFHVPGMT